MEIVGLINQLRAKEGSEVVIVYDNPDFFGPECCISHVDDYSAVQKDYRGKTIIECLRAAVAALEGKAK